MTISKRVLELITLLESAISDSNWNKVEESIIELNSLYEELESDFPLDEYTDDDL
jgi:DNA repair exonuclease SbcCD ATPase subunit